MSKIVKIDGEQLTNFKWKKCVLGVIHPEHTSVKKVDADDSFADLVVTAKPAQLNFKPAYIPPASVPIKREVNPFRRPKSAKPGTDVVQEAFNSIPQARADRKAFRTSLIAGRDLKNSVLTFKTRLSTKKQEVKDIKVIKNRYATESQSIDKLLSDKFKATTITENDYSDLKREIEKLGKEYEEQLNKQKAIIRFLEIKEEDLDLKDLEKMFSDLQKRKEKELILSQHYVLRLKEMTETQARSFAAYVPMENVSKALNEFSHKNMQDRDILLVFLDKVKVQLKKNGLDKENDEFIPFGILEKTLSRMFGKWERDKAILEGFYGDVTAAFCEEFNLTKSDIYSSKPKHKRELELKVVAEFINMYLERLHQAIESKIRSLEHLKNQIEHGKEVPKSITDVLLKFIKFPNKTEKQVEESKSAKTLPKANVKQQKNSKSPKRPSSASTHKKSPLKADTKQTQKKIPNVGRNTQKFTALSSIPEEHKKKKTGISRQNPLDSVTGLNHSLEEGLDDIISDLNPAAGPIKSSSTQKLGGTGKAQARKPEMDSTDGLFNFRKTRGSEYKEVFSSIDAPLMQSVERMQTESVFQSISDLENMRFPKKNPETRSEFITSGVRPFHPYMDQNGDFFNPAERFPDVKADDLDPLDPYFPENIGKMSPNPSTSWFLRSHHLRSFTNHPFSVNDNPNYYKAQVKVDLRESLQAAEKDNREIAVEHLEKTLEDLKCELNTRKRATYVNQFESEDRFGGNIAKAVTPIAQGLDKNEKEGLILHTYESILEELRSRERSILNQKRAVAYEQNRPPQGKWYELKTNEFTDEMQRHMNSLKPKEEQKKLLNYLAIPDLY
jgi:hypothetical protein